MAFYLLIDDPTVVVPSSFLVSTTVVVDVTLTFIQVSVECLVIEFAAGWAPSLITVEGYNAAQVFRQKHRSSAYSFGLLCAGTVWSSLPHDTPQAK